MILGGEVDCVLPPAPGKEGEKGKGKAPTTTTEDFVELKTNIVISNTHEEIMFERQKLLKHYTQSCSSLFFSSSVPALNPIRFDSFPQSSSVSRR